MSGKPIIAITVGDPFGIGPEVTVKALSHSEIYNICRPVVIADTKIIKDIIDITNMDLKVNTIINPGEGLYKFGTIDVIDVIGVNEYKFGQITIEGGKASFAYIKKAIELAMKKEIDAVTTGPINKKTLNMAGFHYAGHTEIFADLTNTKSVCMMLTDKHMRVSHVTTHIPMKDVSEKITKQRVLEVIRLTDDAVKKMSIKNPKIAVAGYNPHSGEDGLFGDEEIEKITPAIEEAKAEGILAEGPVPPDTVFSKMMGKQFDAVVAMYHDQGHIPMKLAGFKFESETGLMGAMSGVNVTLGLPIIRTSVEHGVAFEIAGKGIANDQSMLDSIVLAAKMADIRK